MSIKREYNFDQVGDKDMYLLHHEEIESLAKNITEAKRIRFFMTFGQSYLDYMRCLEDVGKMCIRDRFEVSLAELTPTKPTDEAADTTVGTAGTSIAGMLCEGCLLYTS